jgi:hypothetical protein
MNFNYENKNFTISFDNIDNKTVVDEKKDTPPSNHPTTSIEINGKQYLVRVDGKDINLSSDEKKKMSALLDKMLPKSSFAPNLLVNKILVRSSFTYVETKTREGTEAASMPVAPDVHKKIFKKMQKLVQKNLAEAPRENVLFPNKENHRIAKGSSLPATHKALAFAAFVFLSPTFIAIASIYGGINGIKAKLNLSKGALTNASHEMKQTEEKNKHQSMKDVMIRELGEDVFTSKMGNRPTIQDLKSQLDGKDIIPNKLERHLMRALARHGVEATPNIKQKLKSIISNIDLKQGSLEEQLTKLVGSNPGLNSALSGELPKIVESLNKEIKALDSSEAKEKAAKQLSSNINEMIATLKNSAGKSSGVVNKEFNVQLRKALRSDAYQALKEDPNNASVKLLHSLGSSTWNDVKSLDAYEKMGKTITGEEKVGSTGGEVSKHIKDQHSKISKKLYTDHGLINKIVYGITHPYQVMGSLASEGGIPRQIVSYLGKGVYDPHGQLSNNPSIQGTTTVKSGEDEFAIQNCYGGSPTIGDDEIAPEFHALIQAAENNQFTDDPDNTIPSMIYYTNLQNLDNTKGEGARSRTIMRLNDQYPLSFTGMTLSKDSATYLMKDLRKDTTPATPEGVKEFGATFLKRLSEGVGKPANGFYFRGKKEKWDPVFEKIINNANTYFEQEAVLAEKTRYEVQGAYQEYVYSMIQAYQEAKLGKDLTKKGLTHPTITTISACKENIDRGGMHNMKTAYLRLNKDVENRSDLLVGMTFGRALSARDRVILEKRMDQVLSLMKSIEPDEFLAEQKRLLKDLDIDIDDYQYTPKLT